VDARWQPLPGWTVDRSQLGPSGPTIDCGGSKPFPSSYARTSDIYGCGPSEDFADACWPGPTVTIMLCLRDARSHTLVAMKSMGPVAPVMPSARPVPMNLLLANGAGCRLIPTGTLTMRPVAAAAIATQVAPVTGVTGIYGCDGGYVWAYSRGEWANDPPNLLAGSIDRSGNWWTVFYGTDTGPLTTVRVVRAYFVATAPPQR
jgi:hypothetical protein